MLNAIYRFFGSIIEFFDKLTGNYIVALALFALIIQILLLPLAIKQQKNSQKQASLQPKVMAIRKKYAGRDDQKTRQKVQEETMELYQKEGYSYGSGCLPLLIQLPVILILYQAIIKPLSYVVGLSSDAISAIFAKLQTLGEFGGMELKTVQEIDIIGKMQNALNADPNVFSDVTEFAGKTLPNFKMGPFDLSMAPNAAMHNAEGGWQWSWLILIPIITFISMYFSMKITRKFTYQSPETLEQANSASMKIMNFMSPMLSTYFAFILPAAIGVYWFIRNIYQTIQQIAIAKIMPMPKFTEEDFKAAEREYKGKAPKKVEKSENAGKVRSLHYIDDEDEDTEYIEPTPEGKPVDSIGTAPLKKDDE